jgi:hypothetical protein
MKTVESGRTRGERFVRIFGRRWGFERSDIVHDGDTYMRRWILYVAGCTLRLHHIMRPDRDRAPHNHPFWFITFPLGEYREVFWISPDEPPRVPDWLRKRLCDGGWTDATRWVRAFRPAFRGINFRHRIDSVPRPVWTIVLTGPYNQMWGFFPSPEEFVPYRSYLGTTDHDSQM